RLAGFSPDEARVVAHASQYVDDAVDTGFVSFDNGAMYARISSAHKMLDYRNFEALADHLVWVPFHFLPGNGGLPAGQEPPGPFVKKLVCVPDSPVARDMIASVIAHRHMRHALHRLGITMHVYADTWAHQGFAGFPHEVNHATDITGSDGLPDHSLLGRLQSYFINAALPLGHGTVLGNPDKPYLVWGYTNGLGERIERNNPLTFLDAADHLCKAMQRFRAGDAGLDAPGIPPADRVMIAALLSGTANPDENARHAVWLEHVQKGTFSFGAEDVRYVASGPGSWKHEALGVADANEEGLAYRPEFLRSDWKLFHDALQAHRLDVMNHILPEYGICAA
ncbi:MAG TPA: DUF6765 family protein, partial [Minicystis sp.]|nr:DUF6765 family protein [Minicystis sp.]